MKHILIVLFVMISGTCIGQTPKLELTKEGVAPIMIEVGDMSAADIYSNAKAWVQKNYTNPNEVLKGDTENEYLRVDGFSRNAMTLKSFGMENKYDMYHSIEIDIKEGNYQLTYVVGELWTGSNKALFGWKSFFKKDGSTRKSHVSAKSSLEDHMNATSDSLYEFIIEDF